MTGTAPVLKNAVYVRIGGVGPAHVVEDGGRLTLCANFNGRDARAKTVSPDDVLLSQVCGHCAEHRMDILEVQGKIKNGWHSS